MIHWLCPAFAPLNSRSGHNSTVVMAPGIEQYAACTLVACLRFNQSCSPVHIVDFRLSNAAWDLWAQAALSSLKSTIRTGVHAWFYTYNVCRKKHHCGTKCSCSQFLSRDRAADCNRRGSKTCCLCRDTSGVAIHPPHCTVCAEQRLPCHMCHTAMSTPCIQSLMSSWCTRSTECFLHTFPHHTG